VCFDNDTLGHEQTHEHEADEAYCRADERNINHSRADEVVVLIIDDKRQEHGEHLRKTRTY